KHTSGRVRMVSAGSMPSLPRARHPPNDEFGEGASSNRSGTICSGELMGKVTCEISMSLDGFIAGPNVRVGNGMGDDGDRLHDWFDAKTETDDAIVDEIYASTGERT